MSQKLPVNSFEWTKDTFWFNEDFIKNYHEESDERYFLEVDVKYPENVPSQDEPLTNLHDKTEYVIHIRN